MGVPALAVSLDSRRQDADFSFAARIARKMAVFMLKDNPDKQIPLNINIPAVPEEEIRGVAITKQGRARLIETFEKRVDPRENIYYWLAGETQVYEGEEPDSDSFALSRKMISITPIYYDLTRHDTLKSLNRNIRLHFP
jgi:5'-nucleotidase